MSHSDHNPTAPAVSRVRNALLAGGLVTAAAVGGSLATDPESAWYRALDKPDWQPPKQAFPIAWTSLYAGIAITATLVQNELQRRGDTEQLAGFRRAMVTNLALNGAWSWLFFRSHHLAAATAGAAALAASSARLARRAGRARGRYGASLLPYAAWTAFATALAGEIWRRNQSQS